MNYTSIAHTYKTNLNLQSILMTHQSKTLLQQMGDFIISFDQSYEHDSLSSLDIIVEQITELAAAFSKLIAKRVNELLNFHDQLLQNYHQNQGATLSTCSGFLNIFVIVIEQHASLIKKNKSLLINLLNRMLQILVSVPFDVNQEWCNPPQGFNEDQQFTQEALLPKQILSYFDRIAAAYNYNDLVAVFKEILPEWYYKNQEDWRYRFAVFMVMSQLGEDKASDVKTFIDCALDSINHPHPKVRFSVLQMIGQIADDMRPNFQQKYTDTLIPVIINALKDPIPRVHSHALACLTNFIEDFDNFILINPYIDDIINSSFLLLQSGNSNTKQNAMSVLASVGTITGISKQQIQRIIECSSYTISNFSLDGIYKQLINQTIQTISIIIATQKRQLVQQYLNQMVTILKSMQNGLSHSYFMSAWSRICISYENFTDLSDIFPRILEVLKEMLKNGEDQLEVAIGGLQNTITAFKTGLKAYTNQIINFVKESLDILPKQDKLRSNLYSILDTLITSLKCEAPDPQWQVMAKLLIQFFLNQVDKILDDQQNDSDYVGLQQALKGPQNAIQCIGYLFTSQILKQIMSTLMQKCQKISQHIAVVNQNLANFQQNKQHQQDQLQKQQMDSFIQLQKQRKHRLFQAKLTIPDIFRSIIKVCKNNHQELINQIIQVLSQHASSHITETNELQNIRYGIYYICNFIDQLSYNQLSAYINYYESTLKIYSLNQDVFVRNSAVYGLGVLFLKYPKEIVANNMINEWLEILWKSLNISNDSQLKKRQFNFAQDNIISALGKCIKAFGPSEILGQNIYTKWLDYLPLNTDKVEGDAQQQYLIDLLKTNPQMIIKNQESLLRILTIFGKYLTKRQKRKKESIDKIKESTKQCIFLMKSWPLFQESSNYLWQNLAPIHKNILSNLMS